MAWTMIMLLLYQGCMCVQIVDILNGITVQRKQRRRYEMTVKKCIICGEDVLYGIPLDAHELCLKINLLKKLTELVELTIISINNLDEVK